jgi:DNA-binding CsgD family transcriptional regulator
MIERKSSGSATIAEISERFGLTAREQETVQFLRQGFTSKEIAQRMNISPNTVKAFIRLVMVKMGVSTRSGIIGKVVCPDPGSWAPRPLPQILPVAPRKPRPFVGEVQNRY